MKKILKYMLLAVGGLLIVHTLIQCFTSNLHVGLLLEGAFAAAIFLFVYLYEKIGKYVRILIGIIFCIPCVVTIALVVFGRANTASFNEDVVIVLGAGIQGETVSGKLAKRLDQAVAYSSKNPHAMILVCGGQGPEEDITEALAMERYLLDKGVRQERIFKEDQSTSTYENLANAKPILESHYPQGFSGVLITNDYHIYRAVAYARQIGITVRYIGVQTKWYDIPANSLREMLAIVKLWVMPPQR